MLTNCCIIGEIILSFFVRLVFFIPRGVLDCCDESQSLNSGANFCFVSTLFLSNTSPVWFLPLVGKLNSYIITVKFSPHNVSHNIQTAVKQFSIYFFFCRLHKNTCNDHTRIKTHVLLEMKNDSS